MVRPAPSKLTVDTAIGGREAVVGVSDAVELKYWEPLVASRS